MELHRVEEEECLDGGVGSVEVNRSGVVWMEVRITKKMELNRIEEPKWSAVGVGRVLMNKFSIGHQQHEQFKRLNYMYTHLYKFIHMADNRLLTTLTS